MAFNKKNKRQITVEDQRYFWSATGNDGWISLCIMTEIEGSSRLTGAFDYHHIPVRDKLMSGVEVTCSTDQFVITPFIIKQVILYALSQGWKPFEKSAQLNLGALDDKINLRLDKNRVSNFKKTDA